MLDSLLMRARLPAAKWAESNLRFPRETSDNAPGPLSFDRTPYLREPLNACFDPTVENVYFCGGTQLGKTALLIAFLGCTIGQRPGNGIWSMVSQDQVRDFSHDRLMPFISGNPCLARYLKDGDPAAFKPLSYELSTMKVSFVGTGSPANLASKACAWVVGDEASKYPRGDSAESNPLKLLRNRTKGYPRRLHIFASSPTSIEDYFWQEFIGTDMRQYFVPCPFCRATFALEFNRDRIRWDKTEDGYTDLDLAARTTRYICPHCKEEIYEEHKPAMLAAGHWAPSAELRHQYAEDRLAPSTRDRGYQISSLYSPFRSWGDCVREYLKALQELDTARALQDFRNSWEGLPWEYAKVTIRNEQITALCASHRRGTFEGKPYYISVGYDPGGDATHWVACAVFEGGDLHVLDWGTILRFRTESHLENIGTDDAPVWRTVVDEPGIAPHFQELAARWPEVPTLGFIDAGYQTKDIYDECLMLPGQLTPTKGSAATQGTWYYRPAGGVWEGLTVVAYSDHTAKTSLYSETIALRHAPHLLLPREDDVDVDLVRGLSGQKLVRKNGRLVWRDVPGDHYGDCIKLSRIGWWVMGQQCEGQATLEPPAEEQPAEEQG